MKEIKVDFLENFSDIVCFQANNFFKGENIFLETKNVIITALETKFQRYYIYLNNYLDLKEFKMEISK